MRCFAEYEVALFACPNPDCFPEEVLVEGRHGQQFEFPVQGGEHHVSSFMVGVVGFHANVITTTISSRPHATYRVGHSTM